MMFPVVDPHLHITHRDTAFGVITIAGTHEMIQIFFEEIKNDKYIVSLHDNIAEMEINNFNTKDSVKIGTVKAAIVFNVGMYSFGIIEDYLKEVWKNTFSNYVSTDNVVLEELLTDIIIS